jgi:hypothetical protein
MVVERTRILIDEWQDANAPQPQMMQHAGLAQHDIGMGQQVVLRQRVQVAVPAV